MTRLCVLCSHEKADHPVVGNGYKPHEFQAAERRSGGDRRQSERNEPPMSMLGQEIHRRHARKRRAG